MSIQSTAAGPAFVNEVFVSQSDADYQTSISICSSPAGGAQAGGDWCEVLHLGGDVDVLTIGDVSGHGAMVAGPMAKARACILAACRDVRVPSDILAIVNGIVPSLGEGMIVTAIVAIVDHRERTLTFANAGHPPPLLLSTDEHAYLAHPPADIPLGVFPTYTAANYIVALPQEALLVLYTDGVSEHGLDPIAGETDLVDAARFAFRLPERKLARAIMQHVFATGRGSDDAAAIALRTISAHRSSGFSTAS
jgi:serine phosphatase RsbU (regulator of sigma subunit)